MPPEIQNIAVDAVKDADVPWLLMALTVVIAAAVAWAVTEAIKKTAIQRFKYKERVSTKDAKRSLWWLPMLAVLSTLIGFGVGAFIGAVGWEWEYAAALGAGGGSLASFIVYLLKKKAKKAAGVEDDEPTD
jgi:H+/Cl- antiporter ClcA